MHSQADKFVIYNTLTRKKETFTPAHSPHAGLYVCGPTVYSSPHLGHARGAITYDVLFRYLKHLGYHVRYVRNITDVGHLEDEVEGAGEDRIQKRARIERLEPMELVQQNINRYNESMRLLNVLPPGIEPHASGHIIEQQQLAQKILDSGYGYVVNGSVYFDVMKYNRDYQYGKLSGRKVEDLMSNTRQLEGQQEKKSPLDFALWKKASPEHLMHWPSPWSEGFPGWHIECSAMSMKYLGENFDIHGGGMDLLFPHHECEIAQTVAAQGRESVRYWMHNNMITIKGQKMARSLNNFITLDELFSGSNPLLQKAYNPMAVRFFILLAHYRSTLDFSNEALQSAEKGLSRLMKAVNVLHNIHSSDKSTVDISKLEGDCYAAVNDDMNTPVMISHLFEGVKIINSVKEGKEKLSGSDIEKLKELYTLFINEILGLEEEKKEQKGIVTEKLIDDLLELRIKAKQRNDFETADRIRLILKEAGVIVRDKKDGFEWEFE